MIKERLHCIDLPENCDMLYDSPMSEHTSFRIGGPADAYAVPYSEEALISLIEQAEDLDIPWMLMGNGTNLLVSDLGIEGLVIDASRLRDARVEGTVLYAQCGCLLSALARIAQQNGLKGFEFASGIPGTLGGAVFMNAGAYGGEMVQCVRNVRCYVPRERVIRELDNEAMDFGYRHSRAMEEDMIVLSAELVFEEDEPDLIQERMNELTRKRREKQPLEFASAGSFFKRPKTGYAAALIEQAGLKGAHVGDAEVSTKHSGFVINRGHATAADVLALGEMVRDKVYQEFSVELEMEVRFVGRNG